MDFLTSNVINASEIALDNLSLRHKLIASNIANAETSGYKRKDVTFEDQLAEILKNQDVLQQRKEKFSRFLDQNQNFVFRESLEKDNQLNSSMSILTNSKHISVEQVNKAYGNIQAQIVHNDNVSLDENGNNISIEHEMVELSRNGTKYTVISSLLERKFRGLKDVIKGGGI